MAKIHFLKEGETSRKKNYIPASTQYKEIIEELLDESMEQQDCIDKHKSNPIEKVLTIFQKPIQPIEPPALSPLILNEEKSEELKKANERIKELYQIHEDRTILLQQEYQCKANIFQRSQDALIYQMFFWRLLALAQCGGILCFLIGMMK